jgi:O-antigen ligase
MRAQEISETSAGTFEKAFVVFGLLLSTGAFMNLAVSSSGGNIDDAAGTPALQVLWAVVDITIFVLLMRRRKEFWNALRNEPWLIALIVLAFCSVVWSDSPALTIRRSVAFMSTILFGTYLGLRYPVSQQLRLIAGACAITIVFSYFFGFLGLGNAVDQQAAVGWIGVFVQKNTLGRMMVLSAIVFLLLRKTNQVNRTLANFGVIFSLVLIALSRSTTAAVVLTLLLLCFPIMSLIQRNKARAVQLVVALGILAVLILFWIGKHLEVVSQVTGKDVTLTGRLEIWIFSVVFALHKPWLGYGYNAFWINTQESAVRVWKLMHWQVPHAHNGLLEIWLELGLVGVAVFMLGFFTYVNKAFQSLRAARTLSTDWALIFLVFFFLSNLTESAFMSRHSIFVILYVSIAITLTRHSQRSSLGTSKPAAVEA